MPIYHDHDGNDRRIFAGVDQGAEHIGGLPVTGERGEFEVRYGRLNDAAGYSQVASYLSQSAPHVVIPDNSRVRIIGTSSQSDHNRVVSAVRLVNSALPETFKLGVDPNLPNFSLQHAVDGRAYFRTGEELANTIHIEFVPGRADHSATAAATTWNLFDHAYMQIFQGANSYTDDRQSTILLAHELMHALGLDQHVSSSFDTIMEGTTEIHASSQGLLAQPMSLLYPVDREALRVLYSRLESGDDPMGFRSWADISLHVHGNGPNAGFGVALRNGYAEPWAYGYLPDVDLGDNAALSGKITWSGSLLGLTPDALGVAGDAEIAVDVGTMVGNATFANLESWSGGPGQVGTGATWGDGDLEYSIEVRGRTFRETGGDEGRLTGIFTGRSHEGAAGTLERLDLTAAFGAAR